MDQNKKTPNLGLGQGCDASREKFYGAQKTAGKFSDPAQSDSK
jgi:hypothetical protein